MSKTLYAHRGAATTILSCLQCVHCSLWLRHKALLRGGAHRRRAKLGFFPRGGAAARAEAKKKYILSCGGDISTGVTSFFGSKEALKAWPCSRSGAASSINARMMAQRNLSVLRAMARMKSSGIKRVAGKGNVEKYVCAVAAYLRVINRWRR